MIEISESDRTTPMTVADFKEFMNEFSRQLAAAPPLNLSPKEGDLVPAYEVIGLHSETIAEDGRVLRLYELRGGRTGAQCFAPGTEPGPVRYC